MPVQTLADALLRNQSDAIVATDRAGVITFWNPAAQRIFGFTAAEMEEKGLDAIIPEQFRPAHWTGYDRALAAGDTKYRGQALATRATRADGETIYVELSFAILKDAAGTVMGALATARDITERFQRDRDMRRRLRELEAKEPK